MRKLLLPACLVLLAWLLTGQTAQYPTSVVTDSHLKVASNRVYTTLRGSISASDTVITVADPTRIEVNMLLTVDAEVISVTAISGNNLTVVRGFDGTTAAPHSNGRTIAAFWTGWHHNAMAAEVKAIEAALGPNLSNVSGADGGFLASAFNFSPQQPGGTLTNGIINSVTLAPCPRGVNGTNTGYSLRISGGVGAAESVLVTGGTCVSEAASGTVLFTPLNDHSGAWEVSSASGGMGEAVCALPSAGGEVQVNQDITLLANVSDCSKTAVKVTKLQGSMISGAFTVLAGTFFPTRAEESKDKGPPSWPSVTDFHSYRVDINGFPNDRMFGFGTVANVSAVTGSINEGASGAVGNYVGVSGYAQGNNTAAVGLFGSGMTNGGGSAWGANVISGNRNTSTGLWGIEADLGGDRPDTNPPAWTFGYTAVTAGFLDPILESVGYRTELAGFNIVVVPTSIVDAANVATVNTAVAHEVLVGHRVVISGITTDLDLNGQYAVVTVPTSTSFTVATVNVTDTTYNTGTDPGIQYEAITIPWKIAFESTPGSAVTGLHLRPQSKAGAGTSQPIILESRSTSGTANTNRIELDPMGGLRLSAGGGQIFFMPTYPTVGSYIGTDGALGMTGVTFANLGTSANPKIQWCTDCSVTTPCTGAGSGAWAFANGTQWACPF